MALEGMVTSIICKNGLLGGHYIEPFAAGCGLALSLLFSGAVREVHLHDVDPAISSLWRAILHDTENLVSLTVQTPVSMQEWHRQRDSYRSAGDGDATRFGFSTLFLNRTNRSGIIKGAGVIGGLRQTGNYLLDCLFNKEDLCKRIRRIAKYRHRIHFTALDAFDFLKRIEGEVPSDALLMADPPSYGQGADLYTSFYAEKDHATLAEAILAVKLPWTTTYDACPKITALYRARRRYAFEIQYSAQTKRLGNELLIVSKGLKLPPDLGLVQTNKPR